MFVCVCEQLKFMKKKTKFVKYVRFVQQVRYWRKTTNDIIEDWLKIGSSLCLLFCKSVITT